MNIFKNYSGLAVMSLNSKKRNKINNLKELVNSFKNLSKLFLKYLIKR